MSFRGTRVTVQPTATPLVGSSTDNRMGSSALIRNRGSVPVFVGGPGVTTSTGFQLDAGESVPVDLDDGEVPYGIVSSTTAACHILERGV